jgi:putative phosphoribosyl transferase
MSVLFKDRSSAGRELAARLADVLSDAAPPEADLVVLGLARGGVPVAAEVAVALGAPLDVAVVRKLGAPGQPELAMGAIAGGRVRVLNGAVVRRFRISPAEIEAVAVREGRELTRRERECRGDRPAQDLTGRTVVLVDDGLATGMSMRAAVEAARASGAGRVVVAVPVGAPDSCRALDEVADLVLCLHAPDGFGAVSRYYADFKQTTTGQVRRLLDR